MAPGDDARGITGAQMAAREEATLRYPGSDLVFEDAYDEGQGHGFDNLDRSALISRWWRTDAEPRAVFDWFRHELTSRGWKEQGDSISELAFFHRERASFAAVIRRHEWFAWWPPGTPDGPGAFYEVHYSDRSFESQDAGDR